MFHIVFNSDENYIKYSAVLMTSIVKNTNVKLGFKDYFNKANISEDLKIYKFIKPFYRNKDEKYIFHIIINQISDQTRSKLIDLQNNLNQHYPCEIIIHNIDDSTFHRDNLTTWNGNYSTYYRLKIASLLDKDINICLYLDIDMLVMSDLRQLWTLDLSECLIATPPFILTFNREIQAVDTSEIDFIQNTFYFNSGFMLINLDFWRKQRIEKKIFNYLTKYKYLYTPDELVLNQLIKETEILKLYPCWNYPAGMFNLEEMGHEVSYYGEVPKANHYAFPRRIYTDYDINIVHFFLCPKPWDVNNFINKEYKLAHLYFREEWWKIAHETAVFIDDLIERKKIIGKSALNAYSEALSLKLKQMYHRIASLENTVANQQIKLNSAKSRIQNHLSYKLGQALITNSKSILGYIRMPFVLSYIKDKHKFEQKAYEEKIKENPNLALPPLEAYPDYKEALKEKECFTYKLGEAFIKASKNWYGGGVYQVYPQRCA
ncbi:TPA: glycosyltransferase family 8 protein [Campylobacter jejuni]|uniref:Putative glycosyltransferase n=1 Tax=Campylobacter jejuni subsp. jejuni TaxID=32022 RepID=A0A0S2CGM7_CAMJU|nr:putative glycosyltransferase [Campylobacter jejuni subsp. jejuni]EAI6922715.1 glycosyltransferase family 8 protein [Campylobacter jejuni]EAK3225487.1 glycosyltransferase family 8 protein [Campylobacter jejuni]EDP6548910.1 glycosyltransferase family 8 protein [Campylobacter jejuni]EGA4080812.1 glycosyltransferase family 8 protein [Campylobacter jejuni]